MVNYSNDELRWIIVYATSRLFASTLAVEQNPDGGTKFHCRVPHVLIENATSSAFRLNNIDYSFADLYPVAAPQTPLSPIQLIHQRAQSLCDLWARLPKLFLSSLQHKLTLGTLFSPSHDPDLWRAHPSVLAPRESTYASRT